MAELNARIGLRIDTLERWVQSTIILLQGEPAIATVSPAPGAAITDDIVMIKIGDGKHTFAELPWNAYTKASDVYSWAKQSEADFVTWIQDKVTHPALDDLTQKDTIILNCGDSETVL